MQKSISQPVHINILLLISNKISSRTSFHNKSKSCNSHGLDCPLHYLLAWLYETLSPASSIEPLCLVSRDECKVYLPYQVRPCLLQPSHCCGIYIGCHLVVQHQTTQSTLFVVQGLVRTALTVGTYAYKCVIKKLLIRLQKGDNFNIEFCFSGPNWPLPNNGFTIILNFRSLI